MAIEMEEWEIAENVRKNAIMIDWKRIEQTEAFSQEQLNDLEFELEDAIEDAVLAVLNSPKYSSNSDEGCPQ